MIGQHMNLTVILHSCWLVANLTHWHCGPSPLPLAHLFRALFLLYQYLECLDIPPAWITLSTGARPSP